MTNGRSFICARQLLVASKSRPTRMSDETDRFVLFVLADEQLHSVWSSSGWGLPSRRSHLHRWCALTTPFQPYHASVFGLNQKTTVRRFAFCCTCPNLTAGRRYRPSYPTEPGLSSSEALTHRGACSPAIVLPTHGNGP